jgi:hypothetical protein
VTLPAFTERGDLPRGIYNATLDEVLDRFGKSSTQRKIIASRLQRIYEIAATTGHLRRFIIFGSFITTKLEPNDIDVFMIMEDTFDVSQLVGESHLVFDHAVAQTHFGGSVFWIRRLAAFNGEQAAIEQWQIKRDGSERGIVEITLELS